MEIVEKIRDLPGRLVTLWTDIRSELKKVTWPSKKEIYGTTIVVLVTVVFFGLYLFLVDSFLQVVVNRIFTIFS